MKALLIALAALTLAGCNVDVPKVLKQEPKSTPVVMTCSGTVDKDWDMDSVEHSYKETFSLVVNLGLNTMSRHGDKSGRDEYTIDFPPEPDTPTATGFYDLGDGMSNGWITINRITRVYETYAFFPKQSWNKSGSTYFGDGKCKVSKAAF